MDLKDYHSARTFRDVFADVSNNREGGFEYLMDLHDEAFVGAAYKLLLGRTADSSGMRYYTGRLRRGFSRIATLNQLVGSSEVRADWREIRGLAEEINRYRRSRTVFGWRLALNDPELGRAPAQRRARILQNALGAQRQLLAQATEHIHAEVAGSLAQTQQAQRDDYRDPHRVDRPSVHRFQAPKPRTISEIRKADLPDRIRAAVGLLDF